MGYQLGVDLGTTFTSAAVARDGRVETVNLGTRSSVVPSVVLVRDDGDVLVGDAAEARAVLEPARIAREFKRRLGDSAPLFLGSTPYSAEALTGFLLQHVYRRVVERMGEPPTSVVITHPASYTQYRLDLLRDAVRRAGIADAEFLSEPEAAALHYASRARVAPGEVIAVYDFGGGTFDAALVRREPSGFRLLGAPQGLERLGGIDFDMAVLEHVNDELGGALTDLAGDDDTPQHMGSLARLRSDSRAAKEALSDDTDAVIAVMLPSGPTEVHLSREQFEQMIRPRIGETTQALERAVASAGITMDGVSRIVLVGGSSRIPLVRATVERLTGRPVAVDADPEHAISLGAALYASGATALALALAGDVPPPPPPPPALADPTPSGPIPVPPIVVNEPPVPVAAVPPAPPPPAPPGPPGPPGPGALPWSTGPVPVATRRPRTALYVALGAVVALAVAGLAFALTRGGGSNAAPPATTAAADGTLAAATTTGTPATTAAPAPTTTLLLATEASASTPATTTTAAVTTTTIDPQLAALIRLKEIRDGDRDTVEGLVGSWVPQVSGKKPGLVVKGHTFTAQEVLADHEDMRSRFGAVLLFSGDYVFKSPDIWISIVPDGFPTEDGALQFCFDHALGPDDCFAKLITHDSSITHTVQPQP